MEGSAPTVSVVIAMVLPVSSQVGTLKYVPLGGNGYTSPHGMYVVKGLAITGDSGGGTAKMSIILDDRFCSMVGYASVVSANTASDPGSVRWVITSSDVAQQFRAVEVPESAVDGPISDTWLPPATILPGGPGVASLAVSLVNEDGLVSQLYAQIFVYNIHARERVPFELLVAARGGV